MNRVHSAVLSLVLAIGGLGLGGSPAHAQFVSPAARRPIFAAPTTPIVPGYFFYTAPYVAPRYSFHASRPSVGDPAHYGSSRPYYRDWSTGRDVRLAKPWLQPLR
jgi:hypothetical protein